MNADIHAYRNPLAEPEHGNAGLRILLVDDHELLRHGLKHFLADALGDVVFGEAGSASCAACAVDGSQAGLGHGRATEADAA